jgi:phage terminase Nu1 subunit (DNA packaging protein)
MVDCHGNYMLQDELAAKLGVTKGTISKYKSRGCPTDDEGKARNWIRANIKPRGKPTAVAHEPGSDVPTLPPAESPAPVEEFTWEARLARARKMEIDVYDAAQAAIGRKEFAQLTSLLGSYQRALQGIADAEVTAMEARIATGELIHRETARAILTEVLVPLRSALDVLPMTERSRCNPQQPEVAEAALRGWRDAFLLRLSQAKTKF